MARSAYKTYPTALPQEPRMTEKKHSMTDPAQAVFSDSHDILMNAPIGIFTSTPEGHFIAVNPALARMLGYDSPEEMIESVSDIGLQLYVDPADRKKILRLLEEHGVVVNHDCRFRRRDGTEFWAGMNVRTVRGEGGRIIAYQGHIADISERKQAEESIRQHQRELIEINRIGAIANSTLELDVVLNNILVRTLQALNASVGMIFLKEPVSGCFIWGASQGLSEEFVNEFKANPIQVGEGLTGTIALTGEPIYIPEESSHDPRITRSVIRREGLNSFLGVPIRAADEVIGVMNILTRPPSQLSQQAVHFCSAIGSQVGMAVRNAQLYAAQKEKEEALRESQSLLAKSQKIAHLGSWKLDLTTNRVTWSDEAYRIFGCEPSELAGTYDLN